MEGKHKQALDKLDKYKDLLPCFKKKIFDSKNIFYLSCPFQVPTRPWMWCGVRALTSLRMPAFTDPARRLRLSSTKDFQPYTSTVTLQYGDQTLKKSRALKTKKFHVIFGTDQDIDPPNCEILFSVQKHILIHCWGCHKFKQQLTK